MEFADNFYKFGSPVPGVGDHGRIRVQPRQACSRHRLEVQGKPPPLPPPPPIP
jgi:hypothetical protein